MYRKSGKIKIEWKHQKALVAWFNKQYYDLRDFLNCFQTGSENWGEKKGKIMKDMGVKKDYPDLILLIARGGYHGLFVEVKKPDGKLTKTQKVRHEELRYQGYKVETCYGWEQGAQIINSYLQNKGN